MQRVSKKWEILNPKHQISPYRACGVVGRAHENKSKYLNSKVKTFLFLPFGFWDWVVLFSISNLEFGIYKSTRYRVITVEEKNGKEES